MVNGHMVNKMDKENIYYLMGQLRMVFGKKVKEFVGWKIINE